MDSTLFEEKNHHRILIFSRERFSFLHPLLFFSPRTSSATPPKKASITVLQGVTLYQISLAYKISIAKILEANGLSSPSALKAGQKISFPGLRRFCRWNLPFLFSKGTAGFGSFPGNRGETPAAEPSGSPEKERPPWYGKELDLIGLSRENQFPLWPRGTNSMTESTSPHLPTRR